MVEIGPVVLEKKMKMWIVYNNDNDDEGDGDKFWSEKLTCAFGTGELKRGYSNALVSQNKTYDTSYGTFQH